MPDSSPSQPPPAPPPAEGPPHPSFFAYLVGILFFAAAAYFAVWVDILNLELWKVFGALRLPFFLGSAEMEWNAVLWTLGAIVIFTVVGWFFLETLELYLPRWGAAALSLTLGMGLCGFLFEILAVPGYLTRPLVFMFPGLLLLGLWPVALWASRRAPETGEGGEGDDLHQAVRRKLSRLKYRESLTGPHNLSERVYRDLVFFVIGAITLLTFYHAILFPETYWDSLILYLGYARMMFYEHGIVEKVVGQVGIGLGANYPHLYSLLGASIALASGEWSEIPQRTIAPVAGLATTVLVYQTILRSTRHVNFSLTMTLLYRATPLGIMYNEYAADYALAILFAAAFLYVALLYIETALTGYFILATLLIALSMHLNYLMGVLWLPWGVMILAAHFGVGRAAGAARDLEETPESQPGWTFHRDRAGLFGFLFSTRLWVTVIACVAIASTWYVRNWLVTGNPVYAFFYKQLGGININPRVMESAEKEWLANGLGIGRVGENLTEKIVNSWFFWVNWPNASYQAAPLMPGLFICGAIAWLSRSLVGVYRKIRPGVGIAIPDWPARFGAVVMSLALALFGYHYVLAGFYLYQIVMIIVPLIIMASFAFPDWILPRLRLGFGILALFMAVVPGLAMGLMGFKVFSPVEVGPGVFESPVTHLFIFRHPMPEPEMFYRWRYGRDPEMWRYINTHLTGQKVLTHENRHLVFDPSIELIQIDDWAIQQIWSLAPEQKMKALKRLGISYYLKVENEDRHPINKSLGADDWPALGLVTLEFQAGANILYRIN